ncbi:unnamed protein product [Miscanthus lutarioriparius]|uniref:GAG-pre-integrase domain-containing protein n=1 Tax=Miscanthus lutarioriparius TaxID=422564 RepID=A0A811NEE8_9POAL|nr:unnamed protein product [Miscanthus lutarioriparius]
MASMKFDLPLLDYKTRFALWQVKMRTILAQSSDLDEALGRFRRKRAEEKTAAELWLKLELICMSKDLTSKMHVKMKLFTHKLQEGGSVMNHLSIFKEIIADLVSMEVKYDDEDLALLLLCSLPTSFANFRDTILLSRNELTLVEVYEALQTREKMKGRSVAGKSKNNNNRDKSKNGKSHLKSRVKDKFCRDWFSSYKSVHSGDVVRMGDNNPREIMGIGSVQIKMHDGMIRTLKDVRHIPGMARNLISLSTLDAEGYRHSSSGGVCKVSKDSLIHMIGDMNSAKLYVLRESTLHGSVTAATVSNDEPSKTNLWHMRLGHMSELGMVELIKRDLLDGCIMGKMKFCEHYIFCKHKRVKFNASVHTTKEWKVMIERQTEKKHSPPVLQPQNQSIVDRRTKRSCGPRQCLIEECDIVHYAFSCAEQVENIHEPATYTEAVVSGDREKWISAM